MYVLSDEYIVYLPPDLSGIVAFYKCDYSSVFIQIDLTQSPHIANSSGGLNCDFFQVFDEVDQHLSDFKRELMDKNIMLEKY